MEELNLSSRNSTSFLAFSVLLDSSFHRRIFLQENSLQQSLSKFWSFLRSPRPTGKSISRHESTTRGVSSDRRSSHGEGISGLLNRGEVEMVMERLGLHCSDGRTQEVYGADEISRVLEGKVSLEEVEGAFRVFDGNQDGFLDPEDLQRVLCSLGFKEGMELEHCEKMIRAFDRNGDGEIDFEEFVILMENRI